MIALAGGKKGGILLRAYSSSLSAIFAVSMFVASAFSASPVMAKGVEFTPAELEELKNGKTVRQELPSSRKNGFYGGTAWAIIDAPVEEIWSMLLDWDAYRLVWPSTMEMKELSRKGNRMLIRMRLGHPIIQVLYHIEMRRNDAKRILSFRTVDTHPSDVDEIRGYWRLFPQQDGRTLVAYVVAFRVPMGIVNLVGEEFENEAMDGILFAPGYLKEWLESPEGLKYRGR
jgi:hypothetical protein